MKKGDIVKGCITSIKTYGAFVRINDKVDGMIHISEISDRFVRNVEDYFSVGDIVDLEVIGVLSDNKLSLSYKSQNKSKRKKREVVELIHGFKPLEEKIEEWVKDFNKKR